MIMHIGENVEVEEGIYLAQLSSIPFVEPLE